MKIEGKLFLWGMVFYGVVTIVYGLWSSDWAGTTALAFTAFMAFLVGFYLVFTAKRVGLQPEDDVEGNIEDADPDYGFSSPTRIDLPPIGLQLAKNSIVGHLVTIAEDQPDCSVGAVWLRLGFVVIRDLVRECLSLV